MHGNTALGVTSNNLMLQGGYGEVARTFNSFEVSEYPKDIRELAFALWRWADFPEAGSLSATILKYL